MGSTNLCQIVYKTLYYLEGLAFHRGQGCSKFPTTTLLYLAMLCPQVPVKDTVGCGDSFAAAIVLGFIRGHDLSGVLALANAVGAATAMGVGAGRNVASADTVMSLLRREVSALKGGIEGDVEGIAEGTGRDGDGQSVAEKRELIVGTDVALGDGLTLSTAMKEVAASIDAISVLQMSLDDADN